MRAHEFVEIVVTQCVPAARADEMTVEIDVIADDALDGSVWRAVEHGIEAVSSHSTLQVRLRRRYPNRV